MHTLLCVNRAFLQHAAVCLISLLANNPDLLFDFVIASQPDEPLDEDKLRRSLAGFGNFRLRFLKFAIPQAIVLPLNPLAHYTIDTYTRLWLAAFFPAETSRVLYLDADIVVTGSIAQLWRANLGGALLGAVDIPGSTRGVTRLGMRAEDGYFNAGMLLIDLAQWRATRAEDTVLDYIRENPDRVLYDQDALNACFHHRRSRLDYKWNVIRPFYRDPPVLPLDQAELEAVCRDAVIIHFNGGTKPWNYVCDHPRRAEYTRYLRMTDWRDYRPPDQTLMNMLRHGLSATLPRPVRAKLKSAAAVLAGNR